MNKYDYIKQLPELIKDLNIRTWECPNCTNLNDRDINASTNIMFEGVKMYMKEVVKLQLN